MTPVESTMREPLAIVGMSCRLPGGINNPEALWHLLCSGGSTITTVPADRWNNSRYYHADTAVPVRMHTLWGGFVDNLEGFDAKFWGITPREALRMDPQQRWILECAWEAIEDAGFAPSQLCRTATGVYIGAGSHDYANVQITSKEQIDVHTNLGSTLSIIANRISYFLDFTGPSLAVDTACSSSLVAINLACEAIWKGEIDYALAGGVNALIAPESSVGFSKAQMASPSGQCFAFDERANGYVRSEGAGILMLLPLSAALAQGARPYATVRASVINQDGRTSSITVPAESSQSMMLREAYRRAGMSPARVGYMEAHGTGTPVGDAIEASALGAVLSEGRPEDNPCLIGSVKTNIGHLETASGVAGVMKAALVLREGRVPPSRNFETPNPNIDFKGKRLRVVTEITPMPAGPGELPVAAVNSFGFGGTNAHLVLEAAPKVAEPEKPRRSAKRPFVLPVSGKDDLALRAYAKRYRHYLGDRTLDLAEVCYSAGAHKEHHERRAVILAEDARECREQLRRLASGQTSLAGVTMGSMREAPAGIVFVFTGQGAHWWGMGQQLLAREPVFRQAIETVDAELRPLTGWSLLEEMTRREAAANFNRTAYVQPAIFALQVALVELWRSWGVTPSSVVGHSVGEVAAAWAAGIYTLADAVRVIYHRSRLQEQTRDRRRPGGMYAVGLSETEARQLIAGLEDKIQVAVLNSPSNITLAGDEDPLAAVIEKLVAKGRFVRQLPIRYAFHTHHMDPIRDELVVALTDIEPMESRVPFVSTVTAEVRPGEHLDGSYWWRNVREPVRFAPAMDALIDRGERLFIEIGPHPALRNPMAECLENRRGEGRLFHSLKRDSDETLEILTNLAQLHTQGVDIDWRSLNQAAGQFCRLPAYPWTRERFWIESAANRDFRCAASVHPLLGLRVPGTRPTYEFRLDPRLFPYLYDHRIWDSIVFPAAGYCEIGFALCDALFPGEDYCVESLEVKQALFVSESDAPTVRVELDESDNGFFIYSSSGPDPSQTWDLNSRGRLVQRTKSRLPSLNLATIRSRLDERYGSADYYADFHKSGYRLGESFRHVRNLWCGHCESLVELETPSGLRATVADYRIHPAVLDACFQGLRAAQNIPRDADPRDYFYLPAEIGRVRLLSESVPDRLWAYSRNELDDGKSLMSEIMVYNDAGQPVVEVVDFKARWAPQTDQRAEEIKQSCYRFRYEHRHLWGSGAEGPANLASVPSVIAKTAEQVPEVTERYHLGAYRSDFCDKLEEAAVQAIANALLALGWAPSVGDAFTLEELAISLGILEPHYRLLEAQLNVLADSGCLRPCGRHSWVVLAQPLSRPVEDLLDPLVDRFEQFASEAELQRLAASALPEVLTGEKDAVELFFPDGRAIEVLGRFYREGGDWPATNELMRIVVEKLIETLPTHRTLRVLEIGGGTGSLTRAVLPALPQDRCEYTFTDISQSFTNDARASFKDARFLRYITFDIERDAAEQGIDGRGYDLILASNVIHATADLAAVLRNLSKCLAVDGILLFVELTEPRASLNNVFGLLPGWWRYRDSDLRPDSALMSRNSWEALLRQLGFRDVGAILIPRVDLQTLFLARSPKPISARATAPIDEGTGLNPPTVSEAKRDTCVILAEGSDLSTQLQDKLLAAGRDVVMVRPGEGVSRDSRNELSVDPMSQQDWDELFRLLSADGSRPTEWVHCWTLRHARSELVSPGELASAQVIGVHSLRGLLQALTRQESALAPRLMLVTRGRVSVRGELIGAISTAPLTGFCRVANNEHPEWPIVMVDLDPDGDPGEAGRLFEEITLADGELEIAYRRDLRHVNRLHRLNILDLPRRTKPVDRDSRTASFRLELDRPGALQDLFLAETPRRDPGTGEVEVAVKAGGINFRDLMKALGVYPGNPADLKWLGDDVAGTVVRVGAGVEDLHRGDKVAGIAPYGFRSFVTVDRRLLFTMPLHLTFPQAATLPTVFATAYYALVRLARMTRGERILIHAGTGGVGTAAIQIAKDLGLEIFATAGSSEKRQLLTDAGVHQVMDSRSLDFADQVRALTRGEGVDCVLNSLAGEFIPKGVGCLRPFGRFIEIGKVDVYNNTKIGLRMLKDNISFFVFDVAQLLRSRPEYMVELGAELKKKFDDGTYTSLPLKTFPVSEAVEAFRHMSQGKHIGKNVLDFDVPGIRVAPCTQAGHLFVADGTYLITGGAGGFGFEVAKWMVANGARNLVLMSRSGPGERAREEIETLRANGVKVVDARADVTDRDAVKAVIDRMQDSPTKLRGVIHSAMVINDLEIAKLDHASLERALNPKMLGSWILHELTLDIPLDLFILFSSFSTVTGGIRQGNYSAGNAFLDALAEHRIALGLPALSVNWGALAGAGVVQRNPKTVQYLEKLGLTMYSLEEAFGILQRLLERRVGTVAASLVDWVKLASVSPLVADSPVYSLVARDGADVKAGAARSQIQASAPERRHRLVVELLQRQIASVFNAKATEIDERTPLGQLGIDSLMAVELINLVELELGVRLPMGSVLSGPNLWDLAESLVKLLSDGECEDPNGVDARSLGAESLVGRDEAPDLASDALLADDIRPQGGVQPSLQPRAALLTGGTGFLGAFLIRELLSATQAEIWCLVQAESDAEGLSRLSQNLERYGLWDEGLARRIVSVCGDIAQPRLGLSEKLYARLAASIDVIYHCAATLNFVLPYAALKSVNVDGTREILRFACQGRAKTLHHVSSIAVSESVEYAGQQIGEADELRATRGMVLGYSKSKWVAERLVLTAKERGLPVTVYRPSFILGDSKTGMSNRDDFVCTLISNCLQVGACFDLDVVLDASPVDYVSAAIVYLSRKPDATGRIFHLQNPHPIPFTRVISDCVRLLGVQVAQVDYRDWTSRIKAHARSPENRMYALLPFFTESHSNDDLAFLELNTVERRPVIGCRDTLSALEGSGIACPRLEDPELLRRIVGFVAQQNARGG